VVGVGLGRVPPPPNPACVCEVCVGLCDVV